MTLPLRTHLRPDALTGAVLAFEGLRGAVSVINAPSGCKFGTGFLVDTQDPGDATVDPMEYDAEFFQGQARVPCTNLDEMDYVHGSGPKLSRLLKVLESQGYRLIGVVNGPGTSLIGDNLGGTAREVGITVPVVPIESSGFTGTQAEGFQAATIATLQQLNPPPSPHVPATVNLIGLTLGHPFWQHDREELLRLLNLAGVRVNLLLSTDTPLSALDRIGEATLNVVLHEEYGDRIAAYLQERFGIPILQELALAPYGLAATARWVELILRHLDLPLTSFREEAQQTRGQLSQAVARYSAVTGLPGGATFAIFGDSSIVAPIVLFLCEYLGMVPTLVGLHELSASNTDFLNTFFQQKRVERPRLLRADQFQIREALASERPDIILGSHYERAIARSLWDDPPGFVGISSPIWGSPRLTFRPLIGLTGALTLAEEILSALEPRALGALIR